MPNSPSDHEGAIVSYGRLFGGCPCRIDECRDCGSLLRRNDRRASLRDNLVFKGALSGRLSCPDRNIGMGRRPVKYDRPEAGSGRFRR